MNEMNATVSEHAGVGHTRRKVLRGAAWAVPVIAVSVAAPAAAASGMPPYDLSIEVASPAFVPGGGSAWTWNICNVGTADVPAGTAVIVTATTPKIGVSDYATVNLSLGAGASTYSSYTPMQTQLINSTHQNVSFTITLIAPLPPGACFSYVGGLAWGSNFTGSRVTTTATSTLVDANPANNTAATPAL